MTRALESKGAVSMIGGLLLALVALPATAQIPDEFTNLKVLPKDIGKRELVSIMREYSKALGQRCKFCHVGESPDSLEGYDFASDEPEHKRVTREMMKMVAEINGKLLPAAGKDDARVRCVTCHRGVDEPETLDHLLLEIVESKGVDEAAARYRSLRDEYYGTGSYDFSANTLNEVAETLAQERGDVDGAIAITRLNVEFNPDAARSHLMLGQLYAQKGDKAAAIASLERVLQLDPGNRWAERLLKQVRETE